MERRKGKKKGKQEDLGIPAYLAGDKPSKELKEIAAYMKNNVPTKTTRFLSHSVDYFISSVAIDHILDSPWGSDKEGTKKKQPRLETREAVVECLQRMLELKFFHRARKVPITERDLRRRALKKFKEEKESEATKKKSKKETDEEKDESGNEEEGKISGEAADGKKEGKSEAEAEDSGKEKADDKPKRRRIKLDMHLDQVFVDGKDAYVWIWESTPWYHWILSFFLVIAAVGLCLFPLWPSTLRLGVYYLSIAAGGFLVGMLVLALVKWLIFALIWCLSLGKHHFWIFPNLTEDVGFFASFWPLYHYEYKGPVIKVKKKKEKSDDGSPVPDKESIPEAESEVGPAEVSKPVDEPGCEENCEDVSRRGSSESGSKPSSETNEFEILEKPSTDEDAAAGEDT